LWFFFFFVFFAFASIPFSLSSTYFFFLLSFFACEKSVCVCVIEKMLIPGGMGLLV